MESGTMSVIKTQTQYCPTMTVCDNMHICEYDCAYACVVWGYSSLPLMCT